MDIELIKTVKGFYEIWADGSFVMQISRPIGEKDDVYKARADRDFETYVDRMKSLKSGATAKTIRKTTI